MDYIKTYLLPTLILLLLLPITIWGQSATIQGTIRADEEALGFATIQIKELQIGTSADAHGFYQFKALEAGKYTLIVSYVGFQEQQQSIRVASDSQAQLDFSLDATQMMEEIVVTGTMKPTYVSASPIKVDVVTAKQLNTYLPAAASSIVEGVSLVNGVQEVVACGVCYTNSISINGLEGAYTAILMDGSPIYGNLAAVYGLNGIPNMIIDRFEVIKGPSSTLYGSEAVAGVINIITKDPEKQPLLSVDLMGTSYRESYGNFALAPKIGKSSGFIGVNYAYANSFDDANQDDFGDAVNLDRISLFSKWKIHRKSGKQFSLAGKYYYEDRRNGIREFMEDRAYRELRGNDEIYGESIYTKRGEIFGTYEFKLPTDLKVDFSLSHHFQDSYYGSDYYEATQSIAFANLIWNIGHGKHDIIAGMTSRFQSYDDNTIATSQQTANGIWENLADRQFIPGLFIQDEFRANDRWTLLGGARLDHYNRHGFIFAPRLNVKFKPSDWTTIRFNTGTGFRIVNLFTEDHAFVTGQRTVEIRESLNPERSVNAAMNINQVFTLGKGSGTIDLEAFYTHFHNKIIPDYDDPNKIIYANSNGYAQSYGVGASVDYRMVFPLSFNAGFNLQRVRQVEEEETGESVSSAIEFAPNWTGILTANYQWKEKGLTFAYTARLTGPMALPEVFDLDENGQLLPTSRSTSSDPFSLHDLQIGKRFNDTWEVYGGIQNLWNYRQFDSPLVGFNDPNAPAGFSDFFDTSYAYAPNQGREFYLGVRWNMGR
ncbi:MAG: TonB-dependent receptor [Bacteroidota bacterium]